MLGSKYMNMHFLQLPDIRVHLKKVYHSLYFAPSIVFIAMLFITYWSWHASVVTLNRDIETATTDRANQAQNQLVQRLGSYEQILTGGAGLIRGSQEVSQSEWHEYISTFDIPKRFSGIQGIGYIKTFSANQIPDITASLNRQGIDFKIQPDSPREFYTAILYIDPPSDKNITGIDMFTEPGRRKTMEQARDTGMTTMSPPLEPVLPVVGQRTITMYVPQYKSGSNTITTAERQQALEGYVFGAIRSQDFFANQFDTYENNGSAVIQVSAKDISNTWFSVYKTSGYDDVHTTKGYTSKAQAIEVYGQTLNLEYNFKTADLLRAQRRNTPTWTALAGLLLAFLLSEVVFLLLKSRAKELSTLKEEAVELAKDELLSLASHQLRTPATTVKQYLGMVLQGFAGDITPTQASLLDKAYAGNERQLYIINEMLHVAKIDAGRIVLARHKTDLNKLVQDIVQEAKNDIDAANHKLTLKVPRTPVILKVDAHMLRMAAENLVNNAIKYTLPGGKIKVAVQKNEKDIKIIVQDTGIGIEKSDMEKLYKLFTRLDNPLTQNVSGTGVGLYLAKHLIELHKGTLTLTSKPGVGSTFTITLPRTKNIPPKTK
jgi:signal transduction histidine kinase